MKNKIKEIKTNWMKSESKKGIRMIIKTKN